MLRVTSRLDLLVAFSMLIVFAVGCSEDDSPAGHGGAERPPLGPTDLSARAVSQTSIVLTWRDWSDNEDGFEIFESVDNDSTFQLVERTSLDVESYQLNNRALEFTYFYRVRAFNEFGFSGFSNTSSVKHQWLLRTFGHQEAPYLDIAYHPNGNQIISGGGDYRVKVWNSDTGELLRTLERHNSIVERVAYSPDSLYFATGDDDGLVIVWDATFLNPFQRLENHDHPISSLDFYPDGSRLATADGTTMRVWNVNNAQVLFQTAGKIVKVSSDGELLFVGSGLNIKVLNAEDGSIIETLEGPLESSFNSIAINTEGNLLFAGGVGGTVTCWEYGVDWQLVETFRAHDMPLYSLSVSSDGQYLATGCWDWTIRLWNASTRELVRTLDGHNYSVYSVDFSPDSRYLASCSGDRTIKIWGPLY